MATSAQPASNKLQGLITRQFGMLVAQFLLGMIVNLIGTPSSTLATWSGHIALLLHVLLAIGLLANAIVIVRTSKGTAGEKIAASAAVAVGLAFIFGLLTLAAPLSNLWSFGMAAAFIAAFAAYGRLFATVKTAPQAR